MPIILATKEAELKRIMILRQIVLRDPISIKPITKKRLVEWLKVQALNSNSSTTHKRKASNK
jgi:hypothetical protein